MRYRHLIMSIESKVSLAMWFPSKPGDAPEGLSWSFAGSWVTAPPTERESLVKGPGYQDSFLNK